MTTIVLFGDQVSRFPSREVAIVTATMWVKLYGADSVEML